MVFPINQTRAKELYFGIFGTYVYPGVCVHRFLLYRHF
jgi:hypothetical protein